MPYRMRQRHLIIEMIDRLIITIEPASLRTDEAMAGTAAGQNCKDGSGSNAASAPDADSDNLDAGAESNLELPGGESV